MSAPDEMRVFFATNRCLRTNRDGTIVATTIRAREPQFATVHPCDFRVGEAKVHVEKASHGHHNVNDQAKYRSGRLAEERWRRGVVVKRGSDDVLRELATELRSTSDGTRKSVLVYIHGYPNTFEESIENGAKLAHVYSSKAHRFIPFVFSWPSNIEFSKEGYPDAETNAEISGVAAARVYDRFVELLSDSGENECRNTQVFLVAHSMGAYVTRHLVQKVTRRGSCLFNTAILAAAHEERNALGDEAKLLPLRDLARQVVVYSYQNDGALNLGNLSGAYAGRKDLGLFGPSLESIRTFRASLSTIKCGSVMSGNPGAYHTYHHNVPYVVEDIREVLSGKEHDAIRYRSTVKSVEGETEVPAGVYRLQVGGRSYIG